ncbi:MAG: right-handed parallel beta-helix repeat-containing protein, partial [Akkermansiaceae bacterium]|nr:right-handed parallel beta-helix repeat-containing protein [Akkermansiaceae bacterium]
MKAAALMALVAAAAMAAAGGREIRLTPADDWFGVLHGGGLQPGDRVILGAGTYTDARRLEMNHRGTAEEPIVIRAAEGARVVMKRPDARQNTINMAGCRHLVLDGLEITGGSAGIRIAKQGDHMAKHLVFRNLHIHHIGGVAITANHPGNVYERLVFRRNHIHHTGGAGEGFYLGVNNAADGSTPGYICNSVVEGNYIHDLNGEGVRQGDGIEIKDGSYGNIIRDNVIHDTNYPGIIVYGTDGKERNVIERNVIWNTGDHGIQAAADAVIRNNIVFDCKGAGIYARTHQSAVVGNLRIVHNTVVTPGKMAVRVLRPDDGKFSGRIVIANNALYGRTAMELIPAAPVDVAGNAGEGMLEG